MAIIDRLERQGMVERNRSEEDRRVVHVSLSPDFKGFQNFHKRLEENIGNVLNKGTHEELDKIFTWFRCTENIFRWSRRKI